MSFLRGILLSLLAFAAQGALALAVGEPAPVWSHLSVEGTEIDFPRIVMDRPAVLVLAGPGCTACAATYPALQGLRDDNLALELEIYVLLGDPALDASGFAAAGFDFVAVPDAAATIAEHGLTGPLTLVLVDHRGRIAHIEAAVLDVAAVDRLRAALRAITATP